MKEMREDQAQLKKGLSSKRESCDLSYHIEERKPEEINKVNPIK